MNSDRVPVNLLGTAFSLKTEDDPAYLSEIVKLYAKKVEEIQQSFSLRDPLRSAIMAGIFLTDELYKDRTNDQKIQARENELAEAEDLAVKMIRKLEKSL